MGGKAGAQWAGMPGLNGRDEAVRNKLVSSEVRTSKFAAIVAIARLAYLIPHEFVAHPFVPPSEPDPPPAPIPPPPPNRSSAGSR
jgi:hypothetical protein